MCGWRRRRSRTGVIGTKGWVGEWVVGGVGWWVDGWYGWVDGWVGVWVDGPWVHIPPLTNHAWELT